jgi:hypothetical protein
VGVSSTSFLGFGIPAKAIEPLPSPNEILGRNSRFVSAMPLLSLPNGNQHTSIHIRTCISITTAHSIQHTAYSAFETIQPDITRENARYQISHVEAPATDEVPLGALACVDEIDFKGTFFVNPCSTQFITWLFLFHHTLSDITRAWPQRLTGYYRNT